MEPGVAQTTVTLVGAGDIASCNYAQESATAKLLGNIPGTVFILGDNLYTYANAPFASGFFCSPYSV
jgi:hypothetical protein